MQPGPCRQRTRVQSRLPQARLAGQLLARALRGQTSKQIPRRSEQQPPRCNSPRACGDIGMTLSSRPATCLCGHCLRPRGHGDRHLSVPGRVLLGDVARRPSRRLSSASPSPEVLGLGPDGKDHCHEGNQAETGPRQQPTPTAEPVQKVVHGWQAYVPEGNRVRRHWPWGKNGPIVGSRQSGGTESIAPIRGGAFRRSLLSPDGWPVRAIYSGELGPCVKVRFCVTSTAAGTPSRCPVPWRGSSHP